MVYIPDEEPLAYIAALGDAPVLVHDRNGKNGLPIAEHNIRSNLAELGKALDRGAEYDAITQRIYDPSDTGAVRYSIQMSRALGGRRYHRILDREPAVATVELGKGSFILLATDGLFGATHVDTLEEGETKRIITFIEQGEEANLLVNTAEIRHQQLQREFARDGYRYTGDNITAILWRGSEVRPVKVKPEDDDDDTTVFISDTPRAREGKIRMAL